jgi:hypothetical protein
VNPTSAWLFIPAGTVACMVAPVATDISDVSPPLVVLSEFVIVYPPLALAAMVALVSVYGNDIACVILG